MITADDVRNLILSAMPQSEVTVLDMTGTSDHFNILVVSKDFAGKSLIEQHKMVFAVLEKQMDKNIHAVQLKTKAQV